MPSIAPPAKILVTGASGFIAIHIVKQLIAKGYSVRGAVRTAAKGDYLKEMFGEKFETAIVADMGASNAYEQAVQGVEGVIHTASLVAFIQGHPDEIIKPAIAGTVGILESALKFGPSVRRVIITSSQVAIGDGLDESAWNQPAVDFVEKHGIDADGGAKYSASKVLSERAAWEFVEKNKSSLGFDIVTLCPGWVWGPLIHEGSTAASINTSVEWPLSNIYQTPAKSESELVQQAGEWIDVRDLADISAQVLASDKAGNQRLLTIAGSFTWQDLLDALNEDPAIPGTPKGRPGATKGKQLRTPSTAKLCSTLGRQPEDIFRPLSETIRDTVKSSRERGWEASDKATTVSFLAAK